MLGVAAKHVVGSLRRAWRTVCAAQAEHAAHGEARDAERAAAYAEEVAGRLGSVCNCVAAAVGDWLLSGTSDPEARVFLLKMAADMARHCAAVAPAEDGAAPQTVPVPADATAPAAATTERSPFASPPPPLRTLPRTARQPPVVAAATPRRASRADLARTARRRYEEGEEEAALHLPPTHPVRLGLAVNHAALARDVEGDGQRAAAVAGAAVEAAVVELDGVPAGQAKDVAVLLRVLQARAAPA